MMSAVGTMGVRFCGRGWHERLPWKKDMPWFMGLLEMCGDFRMGRVDITDQSSQKPAGLKILP